MHPWQCRLGFTAVIANTTTVHGTEETVMFFSDRNCKQRQMKLYEQLNLKDSMPLVSQDTDAFSHSCVLCCTSLVLTEGNCTGAALL